MKKRYFFYLIIAFVFSSCSKKVTVFFKQPKDDVYTKPALKEYYRNTKSDIAVILRVPNQVSSITNGNDLTSKESDLNSSRFYNYIEKEFLKKNFVIRDRAIFEKVLSQNKDVDYSKIKELTNTDLILEVVNVLPENYTTNQVTKKGKVKVYPECKFGPFIGWRIDFKIIKVKENAVEGSYSFFRTPCVNGCDEILGKHCDFVNPPTKNDMKGYSSRTTDQELENFATEIARKMITEMK